MTTECLSILELLELRSSGAVELHDIEEHVRACPRCSGLMRALPDLMASDVSADVAGLRVRGIASEPRPDAFHPGQLWQAKTPDVKDWRFVVAVIGRRRGAQDGIVVAPTSTQVEHATDLDIVVDDSRLGTVFVISVWNFGTLLPDQLDEYVGTLSNEDVERLKSVYRFVLTGDDQVVSSGTGVTTSGPEDERLIWRAEQIERLRPLWRPWRRRLAEAENDEPSVEQAQPISAVLTPLFESGEWDVGSLAEAAHVSSSHIEALLADRLDVTDQTDVRSVAAVIHVVSMEFEEVESALRHTLESSPGGLRVRLTHEDRIAARTFADVPEEGRKSDVFKGLAKVDESQEARRVAIESYLEAVAEELDEIARR